MEDVDPTTVGADIVCGSVRKVEAVQVTPELPYGVCGGNTLF